MRAGGGRAGGRGPEAARAAFLQPWSPRQAPAVRPVAPQDVRALGLERGPAREDPQQTPVPVRRAGAWRPTRTWPRANQFAPLPGGWSQSRSTRRPGGTRPLRTQPARRALPPAHLDLQLAGRTLRSTGRSFPHVLRCVFCSSPRSRDAAPHARARTGRGAARQVTWVPRPCLQLPGQDRRHVLATGVPRKRLSDAGSARGHWGPLRGDADGRVGARALACPHRGPGRHHGGCRRPLREGSGRQAASSATCQRPTPVGAAVTDVSVRKPAARVRPRELPCRPALLDLIPRGTV